MAVVLGALLPVGSVIHSMLTESQFQSQAGSGWVLADGRGVAGSIYASITGSSTVPDARGAFLRSKGATYNPDGDLALGTYSADKLASHSHGLGINIFSGGGGSANRYTTATAGLPSDSSAATGGNETSPKNITMNLFIRIN